MQARERRVAIGAPHAGGVFLRFGEEVVEFGGRRHRGRATMPRDDQRAARIRRARAGFERFVAQPPREKAGRERIARAEHVQHFHFDAAVNRRIVDGSGHRAFDDRAAERSALDHERRARHRAHHRERIDQLVLAARDAELLFRADHEVDQRQDALQVRRHAFVRDEARLAIGLGVSPRAPAGSRCRAPCAPGCAARSRAPAGSCG